MGLSFRILEYKNAEKLLLGIPDLWGFRKNFLKDAMADVCWNFILKTCSFWSTRAEDLAMIKKMPALLKWNCPETTDIIIRGWIMNVINKRSVSTRGNLLNITSGASHRRYGVAAELDK